MADSTEQEEVCLQTGEEKGKSGLEASRWGKKPELLLLDERIPAIADHNWVRKRLRTFSLVGCDLEAW